MAEEEIAAMVSARQRARAARDYARADELRRELAARGIELEDRPDGTTRWQRLGPAHTPRQ